MERITLSSLNALFDYIYRETGVVLFMRSRDNQRQLFVSENFKNIWGVESNLLYHNPTAWNDFLFEEDKNRVIQHVKHRIATPEQITHDKLPYRIRDTQGKVRYLDSGAFLLVDQHNTEIGYFGITREVSEQQWFATLKSQTSVDNQQQLLKNYLFNVLQNELKLQAAIAAPVNESHIVLKHNQQIVPLTEREKDCLHYLTEGKSSKQTAALMHVSPRTVEFHLNNIKLKAQCRTKLELLGKLTIHSS